MKELSIEEKAKRYDEAIERAKNYHSPEAVCNIRIAIENLFPELREHEDDRMRKALIKFTRENQYMYTNYNGYNITKEEFITWLEKQGEQKPDDKVESKFETGDWIIHNKNTKLANSLMLVTNKVNDEYLCKDRDGQCSYNIEFIDKEYRLWTIQDAKDGDVLYECNEKQPFIFKELKTKHIGDIASYCDIFNGIFNPNEDSWTTVDIVPATKEQRNFLFQKMKEAGYKWDSVKKELKKIEQTSTDEVGNYNHKEVLQTIINKQKPADETPYPETLEKAIDLYYYSYGNGEGEFEHLSLEKFRDIVHTFVSDYGQKPAWSEEDEKILKAIHNSVDVECLSKNGLDYIVMVDWFKSLKDRILPQPQQEWSEEDMNRINRLIAYFEDKESFTAEDDVVYANWLKSLRPQNTWKPSERDLGSLADAIIHYEGIGIKPNGLKELFEQLKKLKG